MQWISVCCKAEKKTWHFKFVASDPYTYYKCKKQWKQDLNI